MDGMIVRAMPIAHRNRVSAQEDVQPTTRDLQVVRLRETTIREVYHEPVEWIGVIEVLLPEIAHNKNIIKEFTKNIGEDKDFKMNSLFWKSFEIALIHAIEKRHRELSEFLLDKNPHLFTNSPLNFMTDFMRSFVKYCNWGLTAHNELYMVFEGNRVYFQFSRGGLFLRLIVGMYHLYHFEEKLKPFVNLVRNTTPIYILDVPVAPPESNFRSNFLKFMSRVWSSVRGFRGLELCVRLKRRIWN